MNLSGNPVDYLFAFLGGVVLSFSPCVYPLIPITSGYIGVNAAGSRIRGFMLSLIYVLGLAVTYSVLGLLASLGGILFGRISTMPVVRLTVGILIFIFGLSMLDRFQIYLPQFFRPANVNKKGYFPAFVLGLGSGLIASPCVTPVLGSILVYLADKKNVFYGTTLLFVFALGLGTLLIIVGTFSGILANLPKSGRWMTYIKKISALVLIASGLFFIVTAINRF